MSSNMAGKSHQNGFLFVAGKIGKTEMMDFPASHGADWWMVLIYCRLKKVVWTKQDPAAFFVTGFQGSNRCLWLNPQKFFYEIRLIEVKKISTCKLQMILREPMIHGCWGWESEMIEFSSAANSSSCHRIWPIHSCWVFAIKFHSIGNTTSNSFNIHFSWSPKFIQESSLNRV